MFHEDCKILITFPFYVIDLYSKEKNQTFLAGTIKKEQHVAKKHYPFIFYNLTKCKNQVLPLFLPR